MTEVSDFRALPPNVQAVLRKYRIISPVRGADGTVAEGWTQARIDSTDGSTDGKPLGLGPLLDPNVIARFLAADKTPNKIWLDWMLFHAGGGKEGQKRSEQLFEKSKALFMEERTNGYTENGVRYPPRPRAEVERLWAQVEPKFKNDLTIGDQDLAAPTRSIFGYYRHWPGKGRIYEQVAVAVNNFLKMEPKAKQMNKFMAQEGRDEEMVSFDPKSYASVADLERQTSVITQYHASKNARTDIRVQTVYDDDYLTVIVPLTYAAAVRYGFDEWGWANKQGFEGALRQGGQSNPWSNATGRDQSIFVYIEFKVPMPPWMAYGEGGARRHELDRLAMIIPAGQIANFNEDTIKLYDTQNRQNITLGDVKEQILNEPYRQYDREQEEYPQHAGAPVFKDDQEAQEVVQHLDAALSALKDWGSRFDPSDIVSDFMPNT